MLTFAADVAAVGPVSGVQPLVSLQAVRIPQRLPAVAAEEASARVGEHVPAQLRLLGEALLALGAGEGLFSVVGPQVALEVPWKDRQEVRWLPDLAVRPTSCNFKIRLH